LLGVVLTTLGHSLDPSLFLGKVDASEASRRKGLRNARVNHPALVPRAPLLKTGGESRQMCGCAGVMWYVIGGILLITYFVRLLHCVRNDGCDFR
jgi:hypothetical protein